MNIQTLNEIKKDQKLYTYLKEHSRWYILLNRDLSLLNDLKKEYKEFNRNKTINKINETIDNIDLISNLLKMK